MNYIASEALFDAPCRVLLVGHFIPIERKKSEVRRINQGAFLERAEGSYCQNSLAL